MTIHNENNNNHSCVKLVTVSMVTIHVCIHQLIKNSKGILSNGNFQNNFHALFEENCYIANINRKEEHKQLYDIHVYMDVYYHYHYVLYVSTYI